MAMEFLFVLLSSLFFTFKQHSRSPTETDRVENEHIGNADQYRVTREVPLPYTLDDGDHDDDENEDTKSTKGGWGRKSGSISKRSVRLGEVSGEGGRTGLD
jgi:hypothetical protein